jgi:hypothetical protein
VDYHAEGAGQDRLAHRGKAAKDAPAPEPVEVFGIAALRSVLDSALRPVTSAGSRVTIAQPKAVALAAAAGVSTGIIVDLEPTSIAVIIVRTGLAEVVRDVAISSDDNNSFSIVWAIERAMSFLLFGMMPWSL